MILGTDADHVALTVVEVQAAVPGATPGGDVRLQVRVRCQSFAGAGDAWISEENWTTFCQQLDALDRARQGDATLESISPGELRLRVQSIDRAGHMGIEGELTHYSYRPGPELHALHLRFGVVEFDPTMLPRLLTELTDTVKTLKGSHAG